MGTAIEKTGRGQFEGLALEICLGVVNFKMHNRAFQVAMLHTQLDIQF